MYNNNPYEEYMRNSLGYNINPMMNMNLNNQIYYEDENNFTYNNQQIDDMYPEIYKILYPMVCKACMNIQENISEDLVSRITNDIYINVENAEIEQEKRNIQKTNNNLKDNSNKNVDISNTRNENRVNNFLLRDLIRILVLRELLGNPVRPNRPPYMGGFNPGGPRMPYVF